MTESLYDTEIAKAIKASLITEIEAAAIADCFESLKLHEHSGASLDILKDMVQGYAVGKITDVFREETLLSGMHDVLLNYAVKEDQTVFRRQVVLKCVIKILEGKNLTPLTGDDSEWELIYDDSTEEGGKCYCNVRNRNVFKFVDKNGTHAFNDISATSATFKTLFARTFTKCNDDDTLSTVFDAREIVCRLKTMPTVVFPYEADSVVSENYRTFIPNTDIFFKDSEEYEKVTKRLTEGLKGGYTAFGIMSSATALRTEKELERILSSETKYLSKEDKDLLESVIGDFDYDRESRRIRQVNGDFIDVVKACVVTYDETFMKWTELCSESGETLYKLTLSTISEKYTDVGVPDRYIFPVAFADEYFIENGCTLRAIMENKENRLTICHDTALIPLMGIDMDYYIHGLLLKTRRAMRNESFTSTENEEGK